MPAAAAWQDDLRLLRIGYVPGPGTKYRTELAEPFRAYMERKLGVDVELHASPDFASLINAQASGHVPYAIYSATAYAAARARCGCVTAIAVPSDETGAPGFRSVLLARAGSGIDSLADAGGRRLAMVRTPSVSGRLVPLRRFAEEGVDATSHFAEIVETASQKEAVLALLTGAADVALAWSSLEGDPPSGYGRGILAAMVADGSLLMSDIRVVWVSPLIPYGPHALRDSLPDDARRAIADALAAMAEEDPDALDAIDLVGGGGFVPANDAMFAMVRSLVAAPDEGGD